MAHSLTFKKIEKNQKPTSDVLLALCGCIGRTNERSTKPAKGSGRFITSSLLSWQMLFF